MLFSLTSRCSPVREILEAFLPHKVHDYIIEGVCQALAGQHVLSVVRTGGGKSGYFYGYMAVLQVLAQLPRNHPIVKRLKIPKSPKMIIIYPTKGLAKEMETTFLKLSLSALAINEDTLALGRRRDEDLWKTAQSTSMILLSPEQLVSSRFSTLIGSKEFLNSVCALGIDEMHLIHDWGTSGFRKAFTDIGLVLARLNPSTTLIAVTATLPSVDITKITKTLGLSPGSYSFRRRSNIRHDVKLVIQTLSHGLAGWSFPDLRWIVHSNRKTIIYVDTLNLAHRLLAYLWHEKPSGPVPPHLFFQLLTAACEGAYNDEVRERFKDRSDCKILIATDAAKVGNDWPTIADAVILNPKNPNDILQKSGRAGRQQGAVASPRAFIYFTKAQMAKASKLLDESSGSNRKGEVESKKEDWLTEDMARVMRGPCIIQEFNRIYDNPTCDPPCGCETCQAPLNYSPRQCNCSGCIPERLPTLPPLPRPPPSRRIAPMAPAITASQRDEARNAIVGWQLQIWKQSNDILIRNMPPRSLLPKGVVDQLVNELMTTQAHDLEQLFTCCIFPLRVHHQDLFQVLSRLRTKFISENSPRPSRELPGRRHNVRITAPIVFPPSSYDIFMDNLRPPTQRTLTMLATDHAPPPPPTVLHPVSPNANNLQTQPNRLKRKASTTQITKGRKSKRQKEN